MNAVQAHLGRIEQLEFYSISGMLIAELFPMPHLCRVEICFGMDDNEYFEELDYEPFRTMSVPLIPPDVSTWIIPIAGRCNLDLHGIDASKFASVYRAPGALGPSQYTWPSHQVYLSGILVPIY